MLSKADAVKLANYFYEIDQQCRKDLNENLLISERDYVSRFTTLAMYPNGIKKGRTSIFTSQTLPSIYEQKFGCDGILIFKKSNEVKVGMFEAKWPRMRKAEDYGTTKITHWDNVVGSTSRFSSELKRQSKISKNVVIWEMFFNDSVPVVSLPFDAKGSACVLLDVAEDYDLKIRKRSSKAWTKKDLKALLNQNISKSKPKNIQELLVEMLTCNIGKKIPVDNSSNSFKITVETSNAELITAKHLSALKNMSNRDISRLALLDFKSDVHLIRFLSDPENVSKLPEKLFNKIIIEVIYYETNVTGPDYFEWVANFFKKRLDLYSNYSVNSLEPVDVTIPLPFNSEMHYKEPLRKKIKEFMKNYGITNYYFIDLDNVDTSIH